MDLFTQRRANGAYIGDKDAEVLSFVRNFASSVGADPVAYDLSAGDGATIILVADQYVAAFYTAKDPATRTRPTVKAKDTARDEAEGTR